MIAVEHFYVCAVRIYSGGSQPTRKSAKMCASSRKNS